MPQYISGAKAAIDTLREDRRVMQEARRSLRSFVRRARQIARRDPIQVELLLDKATQLLDDMEDLDDQIDALIADQLAPKLQRRTQREVKQIPDLEATLADIVERLRAIEDIIERSVPLRIEQPESRR